MTPMVRLLRNNANSLADEAERFQDAVKILTGTYPVALGVSIRGMRHAIFMLDAEEKKKATQKVKRGRRS